MLKREEMKNRIANALGLENRCVVEFFRLCDEYEDSDWNNKCLNGIFDNMMSIMNIITFME